ncbi:FtsX-like permease family protein [Ferrimicrobium sp.]|uniref:FtsX-like permease family protein n=1 Tax=Ferrimicrobium sp. TaxID=2926050 RepID=UPI00261D60FB|nr:FtsX-like permease family protein [Ferrimicrobium sp.]
MGWTRFGLFFRGVRFRLGALVFLLIAAVVAILGATVGPIYLGSAQNSVLIGGLRDAPISKTGLQVSSTGALNRAKLLAAITRAPRIDGRPLFSHPLLTALVPAAVTPGPKLRGASIESSFFERTAVCDHLQLDSGHCPVTDHQLLLSARSAQYLGVKVGSTLKVASGLIPAGVPGAGTAEHYVVVGTYAIPDINTNYWWGDDYFSFGSGSGSTVNLDPLIVAPGFFGGAAQFGLTHANNFDSYLGVDRLLQMPLDPAVVNIRNYRSTGAVVQHYAQLVATHDDASASSGLFGVILSIIASQNSMTTLVTVIILELVLLGLIVFGTLIWRMVQSRMGEFRLAQLRGVRSRSIVLRAIGEPLVVLVVASPLGFLGAYLTVLIAGHAYFATGTQLYILPTTYVAGLAVIIAALVVTVVAAATALRRGVLEASRSALRNRGRFRALVDVLIVVVAGVLTAQLVIAPTSGSSVDPLAGAAPAFLGAGIAIVVIALTSLALRLARRFTRGGRHIAWYLSVRQLRARSGMLRQIIPFGIALALVVFGFGAQSVIARHRSAVAGYEVGAGKVLTVSLPKHLGLIAAVDRADPTGDEAMAAQLYRAPSGTTLAVQASRFGRVASWPAAVGTAPVARVAAELQPFGTKAYQTTSNTLTIRARTQGTVPPGAQVDLEITLLDAAQDAPDSIYMPLTAKDQTQRIATGCSRDGCLFSGIGYSVITNGGYTNPNAHFTIQISALDGVEPGAADRSASALGMPWRGAAGVQTSISSSPGELNFTAYPASGGSTIAIVPKSYPTYLPAIVSQSVRATLSANVVSAVGTGVINGLDGNQLNIRPFLTLPSLPSVGDDASIVDLTQAQLVQESASLASDEVWLAKGAPSSVVHRLEREGVVIESELSARALAASYANQPLGLAERLFPIAAAAGIVVVLLGLAFELLVEGRGRIPEFAAMRVLGLHRPRLILAYILEATILVVAAAVAGVVAGVLGARLALPALPEIDSGLDHLHFGYALPIGGEILVVAVVVIAAIAVGALAATRVVGRASFDELRAGDR